MYASFPGRVEASTKGRAGIPGIRSACQAAGQGGTERRQRRGDRPAPAGRISGPAARPRKANSTRLGLPSRALRQGERPEERLRREAQVRAAEAKLANARTEFERHARLIRSNAVSRADYERTETAYRVAQEDHRAALQMLETGDDCPRGGHRGPGGRGSRARRPRGRSEPPARRTARCAPPTTA